MTLGYLKQLHHYLMIACKNPCPDGDVHELRRQRRLVAELIAGWPENGSSPTSTSAPPRPSR